MQRSQGTTKEGRWASILFQSHVILASFHSVQWISIVSVEIWLLLLTRYVANISVTDSLRLVLSEACVLEELRGDERTCTV